MRGTHNLTSLLGGRVKFFAHCAAAKRLRPGPQGVAAGQPDRRSAPFGAGLKRARPVWSIATLRIFIFKNFTPLASAVNSTKALRLCLRGGRLRTQRPEQFRSEIVLKKRPETTVPDRFYAGARRFGAVTTVPGG